MQAIHYQLIFNRYQFVVDDGAVIDFNLQGGADDVRIGDVYLARIARCNEAFCFLEIGRSVQLFIRKKDIASTLNRHAPKVGEQLYVQVDAAALGTKAARATGAINLKSDDLILTTDRPGLFISKKIEDRFRRKAIRCVLQPLLTDDFALVVRSSAAACDDQQLIAQAERLIARLATIRVAAVQRDYQPLRHRPTNQLFSDYATQIDSYVAAQRLDLAWPFKKSATLYQQFDLLAWLERNQRPLVRLANGIDLTIQQSEALTLVDVDSAQFQASTDQFSFGYAVNRAALAALPAELMRRKISGTVVVDCLTMPGTERAALKADIAAPFKAAGITVKGISASGLFELSIRRGAQSVRQTFYDLNTLLGAIKAPVLIDYWLDYICYYRQVTGQRIFQFLVSRDIYHKMLAAAEPIRQLLSERDIELALLICDGLIGAMQPLRQSAGDIGAKTAKTVDLMPFV